MATEGNERRILYRNLLNDPATQAETRKYSFNDWERKLLGDEKAIGKLAEFSVGRNWAIDEGDFAKRYIPELISAPKPAPAHPAQALVQQVAPARQRIEAIPSLEEQEIQAPPPKPIGPPPTVGTPQYDEYLKAQYAVKPLQMGVFAPVQPAFESKKQMEQEVESPAFKRQAEAERQLMLRTDDFVLPTAQEKRKAERTWEALTPQEQMSKIQGTSGFELSQEAENQKRSAMQKLEDFGSVIGATFDNIYDKVNANEALTSAKQRSLFTFGDEKALKKEEEVKNAVYDYIQKVDDDFARRKGEYNIETSVLNALEKGNIDRLPEAIGYNIAQTLIQAIMATRTGGYSMFAQTLPDAYKTGVEKIAQKTNRTPEQVIAAGDDRELLAYGSAVAQGIIENAQGKILGKAMQSKGSYKAIRDAVLDKIGKSKWKQAAASGAALTGTGLLESSTEVGQEFTGITAEQAAISQNLKEFRDNLAKELKTKQAQRRLLESGVEAFAGAAGSVGGARGIERLASGDLSYATIGKAPQRGAANIAIVEDQLNKRNKLIQARESAIQANPEAEGQIRERYQKQINDLNIDNNEVVETLRDTQAIAEPNETVQQAQGLMADYLNEQKIPLPGMEEEVVQAEEAAPAIEPEAIIEQPPVEEVPVAEEEVVTEQPPAPLSPEEELAFEELMRQGPTTEEAPAAPPIAPLNIDFSKNEGRNVDYQGIQGRIKIDSDGTPYVFTKEGDVVYIEGGLSGQTPQQLGVNPLPDDVISEQDIETVLQDENASIDQNQLGYDFDNNTITLYGRPFTYEGVETNTKGQTTALRLRDANGKQKFVRNEDTILEFEIQKELYEKSRSNKPLAVESATAAAEQLQVSPAARPEQVSEPIQQERPVGNLEGNEIVEAVPAEEAPAAPVAKGMKKKEERVKKIDKKSVQSSLESAQDEYRKAKESFDKKRAELDKTTKEDVTDIFGGRKAQEKSGGLFEMPRISPEQREKAIQPFRDRMNKAKEEVNRLTKLLEESEDVTKEITYKKEEYETEQLPRGRAEVRKEEGGRVPEKGVPPAKPKKTKAGRSFGVIPQAKRIISENPQIIALQAIISMGSFNPKVIEKVLGGGKNKNIKAELQARKGYLDKTSKIATTDRIAELVAEQMAKALNMDVSDVNERYNVRDYVEDAILNHTTRSSMAQEIVKLDAKDRKANLDEDEAYGEYLRQQEEQAAILGAEYNQDVADEVWDAAFNQMTEADWNALDQMRIMDYLGETEAQENPLVAEINSLPLSRIEGLGMGQSQVSGTYISTEETNRYQEQNPNLPVYKVTVSIKNPYDASEDMGLVEYRNQVLNDNKGKFNEFEYAEYEVPEGRVTVDDLNDDGIEKLAKLTQDKLRSEGYDSVYFRETKNQEGELVVFDKANVKSEKVIPAETKAEEKQKPITKPSKESAIPEEPTQKGIRFEKGSKLTDDEKKEVYKTLKDSYKEMGRPYTMEIRTSQYTGRDYEARVWLEKASDFMQTSDVTGRKLRYYISLPDGTIAHPTELFPNVSASEMNAAQRSIEYNQRMAMEKMDDITSQLKKSGEVDKVTSAIALALKNGAVFIKEYDSGDVGQKDAAVYLKFPNGATKTIPDYVISTKGDLLGFDRQDLDKYKSGDLKGKIFNTNYQPDWEQFYNENKSAKPTPSTPSVQVTAPFSEVDAALEAGSVKSRAMREALNEKYGKDAVKDMIEITRNFEPIIQNLEEQKKVKKDCP